MPLDSLTNGPFLGTTRNPYSYEKVEQTSRDIQTAWLTLDEITAQLNLYNDTSQDDYLSSLELATRMAIEDYLGMSIYPISWKVSPDPVNLGFSIILPMQLFPGRS